ncbi:MAG TPA: hypothetical protein VD962_10335 [Rubricoccaceae bacterium]|nr:hypothetical protein [Rubricoccaceae bacterium]
MGAAVLAVVVLYALTQASSRRQAAPEVTGGATTTTPPTNPGEMPEPPPLPDALRTQVATLQREIEVATTPQARLAKQSELVEVLAAAEQWGHAAPVQARVAEQTGAAHAWADAGWLFFQEMSRAPDAVREAWARQAIAAYERSLALEENPDVRTDLAMAALYDSSNPMAAVQHLQQVLATDSNHVGANFNMGLLRARIGRIDGAVQQFEKVIRLTTPDNPFHQRAQEELAALRQGAPPAGGVGG